MSRVLIAENDHYDRKFFRDIAERQGMTYDEAIDGGRTIALAQRNDYDLILLDMRLPGIDGRCVLNFFYEQQPHHLERTIATSVGPIEEMLLQLQGFPAMVSLLSKSHDIHRVEDIIREYARNARLHIRT